MNPAYPIVPQVCYHLAYLTANDRPRYQADFLHFRHMTRLHPGVPKIALYIAISAVRPFTANDRGVIDALLAMCDPCPWLEVKLVLWKGNIGRDFSSAEACLRAIAADATADDYVMVRNRSAYGPLSSGWYARYVAQYARFPNTGLVGSTINLSGHPKRARATVAPHVQTYAYLSQWRHLETLATAYPASRCTDRLDLIDIGEIGLSSRLMQAGLGLSCLQWPDELFTADRLSAPHLPQRDMKEYVHDLPLRYKYPAYFRHPRDLPSQFAWWTRTKRVTVNDSPHITLTEYG